MDNQDQLAEIRFYHKIRQSKDAPVTVEDTCRRWVHRYARVWTELKEKGANPSIYLRPLYLNEDQYKWASSRMRRSQTFFRSHFGKSRSFGGVINDHHELLREKLDIILAP